MNGLSNINRATLLRCWRMGGRSTAVLPALLTGLFALAGQIATASDKAQTAYLFSTFDNGLQDGLRFACSHDGYHWTNIPGVFLKPQVGGKIMRDPSIARGPDGTFHLVWTSAWRGDKGFGYASSSNLIHWSDQKYIEAMKHEPDTVNVWAPEIFYDDGSWISRQGNKAENLAGTNNTSPPPHTGGYIICWASTIPGRFPDHLEPRTNNHRMYYTTTRDFRAFTPTKLYLDPGFSVIDCQILKRESDYVLLLKDNTRPQRDIRVAFGETPFGPWRDISRPFTEKFTEGPCALKLGNEWLIYFDAYRKGTYDAVKTRDFKAFTDVSQEVSFPKGHKHGTAFEVPREMVEQLLNHANRAAK